ncbi:MAG: CoA activase [Actinobacteria bacterium]|nr:CoA activase [Actinomycetota bacterium]
MHFVGIDIGSTSTKVAVTGASTYFAVVPTGWSSKEASRQVRNLLEARGIDVTDDSVSVCSTGYGRAAVSYTDKTVTEITCHAVGAARLIGENTTVIDIGGQDTKVILIRDGKVEDFLMNDKCSAGTGKFIEVMANRLEVEIDELFVMAQQGTPLNISSLCTVFAESEIVSYVGEGRSRFDIAAGIVDSVVAKVAGMLTRFPDDEKTVLTGGLSHVTFFAESIGRKLKRDVRTVDNGIYAGALGAAFLAEANAARHQSG